MITELVNFIFMASTAILYFRFLSWRWAFNNDSHYQPLSKKECVLCFFIRVCIIYLRIFFDKNGYLVYLFRYWLMIYGGFLGISLFDIRSKPNEHS